jgi:centromere/kinetochore protein ZW10
MPSVTSDHQLSQAVLDSVQNASYPESEEVIAAELPPSTIPITLKLLERARNEVKVRLSPVTCPVVTALNFSIEGKHPRHQ